VEREHLALAIEVVMAEKSGRYDWGVKCTSKIGWYASKGRPAKFSESEAKEKASELNAKGEDTWEARRFEEK
jgi:hypothetical protein